MHPQPHLPRNFMKLRPHAVSSGLPLEEESTRAGPPADEGEAQEVEGFWLSESTLSASDRCEAAKFDQACLLRMQ
jgi:hypothetical protein